MPGRRSQFTQSDLDEIAQMREAGASYADIAKRFGVSKSGISWVLLRLGVADPNAKGIHTITRTYVRNGRTVRPFTAEEDAQLVSLDIEGLSISQIAARLGRGHQTVIGRLANLARRDSIAESPATIEAPKGKKKSGS